MTIHDMDKPGKVHFADGGSLCDVVERCLIIDAWRKLAGHAP